MRKTFLKYTIITLILLAGCNSDYYSKKWADSNLNKKESVVLVKNFIDLGFTKNRGMIFGFFNNKSLQFQNAAIIAVRISLLLALTGILIFFRNKSLWLLLPFIIIWTGAIGNIIDAIKYGYVVDFIHIHAGNFLNWPFYFNIADAYITIGAFLLFIKEITGKSLLLKNQNV
jgi:signal peptidase II